MERYVATQFYKADSPESRILRESGMVPSEFVLAADAQATIAALQARVQELEEITKVICGHCCEPMEIPSKAVLQSALTQRTAELEAAKQHQQLHDRIFARQRDLMAHYVATIREAIRRLGNSTHSKERPEPYESRTPVIAAFLDQALGVTAEEAERERVNLQAELERVRGLIKALPKVEGEINQRLVSAMYGRVDGTKIYFGPGVAALLQHRQGMEG